MACSHPLHRLTDFREPTTGDAVGTGNSLSLEADCNECDSTVMLDTSVRDVLDA